MKEIEKIVDSLNNLKNSISVQNVNEKQYVINTGLFLLNSKKPLPIYLVEDSGKYYYSDLGETLKNLNVEFENTESETQNFIINSLKDLEVEFDGRNVAIGIINNYEFDFLNILICALNFLQVMFA